MGSKTIKEEVASMDEWDKQALPSFPIQKVGNTYNQCAETDYLIDGLLEADSLAQAFGDSESYKTFFAIGLGCSIATGTAFLGREVKKGGVLFVVGEGLRGLNKRFKAWSAHNKVSLDEAPLYLSGRSADFMTATSAHEVVDSIRYATAGDSISLIVIDTLARNMSGNESSPEDMAVFIGIIDRVVRQELNCTVLVIHHPGIHDKTRGRGTNALHSAIDTDIRIYHPDREIYPNTVRVECCKQKNEERFDAFMLDFHTVDWGRIDSSGQRVKSGVLVPSDQSPDLFSARSEQPRLGKRSRLAFESLKKELTHQGKESIPVDMWRDACKHDGIDRNQSSDFRKIWHSAKKKLVAEGWVTIDEKDHVSLV